VRYPLSQVGGWNSFTGHQPPAE